MTDFNPHSTFRIPHFPGGRRVGLVLIALLYLGLRGFMLGSMEPVWFADTEGYAAQYREGFGGGFFGQGRPWGYPFFLWLTGYRWGLVGGVQRVLAGAAWLGLAGVAAGLFRLAAARVLVFFTILILSLSLFSVQWDVMLLSESLSISVFLALGAAWMRWLRTEATGWLAATVAFGVLLAGMRDANVALTIFFALAVAARLLARHFSRGPQDTAGGWARTWAGLGLVGVMLLGGAAQHLEAQRGGRGWANVGNVLSLRAFVRQVADNYYTTNQDHIDWMARRFQLPAREAAARVGRTVSQAPPLSPQYRAWLEGTGTRAWTRFLLHHPGWALAGFGRLGQYGFSKMEYTAVEPEKWTRAHLKPAYLVHGIFYGGLGGLLGMPGFNLLLAVGALAVGGLWARSWRRGPLNEFSAPLGGLFAMLTVSVLAAAVAFIGDAIETWRHAVLGLLALYVTLALGLGLVVEGVSRWRAGHKHALPRPQRRRAAPKKNRGPNRAHYFFLV